MPIKKQVYGKVEKVPELITKKNNSKLIRVLSILLVIVVIALLAILFSYYNTSKKLNQLSTKSGQQELAKKELNELLEQVGKLIVLPTNETPTVATITDAQGLAKNQTFYSGSSNGDKVLIYFKSQKAYIYSPSKDMLVNVGPVYIEKSATSSVSQTDVTPKKETLKIEVRNGTSQAGLANELKTKLSSNSDFEVTTITDAATTTYTKSVLVDLTDGQKSSLLSSLEKELNLSATNTLPKGEKSSSADVLLIATQ